MAVLSADEVLALKDKTLSLLQNTELLSDKSSQKHLSDVLRYIEKGQLRVISPQDLGPQCGEVPMEGELKDWQVHSWVKECILLTMRMRAPKTCYFNVSAADGATNNKDLQGREHFGSAIYYHDKFDIQNKNLAENSVRSVYGSIVREGSFVSKNAILMPSFVNLGAWIGSGTMIDTWATAGSCAQIGRDVHIAGGVGIGGVLEPASARPVIIGDHAFIGSRAIIVEGVAVGAGAVIAANVCLTSSTPIYDVTGATKKEFRGAVPSNAVVVPGTRIKKFGDTEVPLQCAYIIDYRSEKTDKKVSLNAVLREVGFA